MIFFIIFLIIPLIEVSLFITVGSAIGVLPTLMLCVLSAIAGSFLIRQQGFTTLLSARTAIDRGEVPLQEMFDGICIAVAGALLMTPGFFTDALGFGLMMPPVRAWLRRALVRHFTAVESGPAPDIHIRRDPRVIDVEYEPVDEDKP